MGLLVISDIIRWINRNFELSIPCYFSFRLVCYLVLSTTDTKILCCVSYASHTRHCIGGKSYKDKCSIFSQVLVFSLQCGNCRPDVECYHMLGTLEDYLVACWVDMIGLSIWKSVYNFQENCLFLIVLFILIKFAIKSFHDKILQGSRGALNFVAIAARANHELITLANKLLT